LILDFQAIHAAHLDVFRKFISAKQRSMEPIRFANAKIARTKRLMLFSNQADREKKIAIMPPQPRGLRIDTWAYQLKPLPKDNKLYF